ncbi:helix-turn-helix domain-containing protein [Oceanomicrobium pacificus]|uniref:Helix-turn-helix domain-containing protein n=1 Tax=Oceanomicrobium pacificus TaxID=2692916 RepID=A0A6B0TVF3_9RHOB|nr:AraC family transcriptional regulator [Oceanomicrobium pacificus]MXU65755.1 helix-turn-helix domain-containing protein [Oceanomicrobium pacificus]
MTTPTHDFSSATACPANAAPQCMTLTAATAQFNWSLAEPRPAPMHLFLRVTCGGGRIRIGEDVRGFGAQAAMSLPMHMPFGLSFTPGTKGWVALLPDNGQMVLPEVPILCNSVAPGDQRDLAQRFEMLFQESQAPGSDRLEAMLYVSGLLSVWFRRQLADNPKLALAEEAPRGDLLQRFLALVEERFDRSESVIDYARRLDVTPTHLTRICRRATGKPASHFIQSRVMEMARETLATTDLRVSEIAEELGFSDPAYFTRRFTATIGESPSQYRRLHRHA